MLLVQVLIYEGKKQLFEAIPLQRTQVCERAESGPAWDFTSEGLSVSISSSSCLIVFLRS